MGKGEWLIASHQITCVELKKALEILQKGKCNPELISKFKDLYEYACYIPYKDFSYFVDYTIAEFYNLETFDIKSYDATFVELLEVLYGDADNYKQPGMSDKEIEEFKQKSMRAMRKKEKLEQFKQKMRESVG